MRATPCAFRDGRRGDCLCALNRHRVPATSILAFSGIALTLLLANALLPSLKLLDLIASLYNFEALVAYMYAALVLYKLSEHIVGNATANRALGLLTLAACALMLALLTVLHEEGRVLAAV